jgi:hypothetical protein
MRKINLLLGCLFLSVLSSNAQKYYPMLDSINNWRYVSNFIPLTNHHNPVASTCSSPININQEGEIYTRRDTLIGSNSYKELIYSAPYNTNCSFGFIREDTSTRKVFFLDRMSSPEVMLYDFSMHVNDSVFINLPYGTYTYQTGYYRLDSIGSMHLQAGTRRVFYLNNHTQSGAYASIPLVWIESLGNPISNVYTYTTLSRQGAYWNCPGSQHLFTQFLTCFDHKNKVYYDSCAWHEALKSSCFKVTDTCHFDNICGAVHELSSLSALEVYPNPASQNITLSMDVVKAGEFEMLIRDMTGRKVLKDLYLGKIAAGLQEKTVDISPLPPGMYFIELKNGDENTFLKLLKQ